MSYWQSVRLITGWEFRRFLRVGELVMTVLITAGFGILVPLAMDYFASRGEASTVTIAVTGTEALPAFDGFELLYMDPSSAEAALDAGEVEAVLDASDPEAPVITLESEEAWIPTLSEQLVQATLDDRLAASGIDPVAFGQVLQPVYLQVELREAEDGIPGTLVISLVAGAMLFAIFLGTGLLFAAITGEKTQRITEQIVSAISPQAWIDGKVLGTGLYVLLNMSLFAFGIAIAVVVNMLRTEGGLPPLPDMGISPSVLIPALLFAVLGGALYFMFFAAIAATIDDPAASQRGGIIMIPPLFIGLSLLGLLGSVDNALFRFMSHFPLTSPSAMPIRLLLGDAGWGEALVSLAILAVSVALMRRLAGKIFAVGILMTGKEPSLREMLHWLRRA
mgnify:CR=1 FL=1